jgi:outer membrane biosynthesis protein TonB
MKNHRSLALGAMILFGALLFGAPHAGADPVGPVGPTDLAIPTADPEPPLPPGEPTPQIDLPATDIVAEEPCWQTDSCPPPVDPCEEDPASCEPTEPEEPPTDEPTDEPTTEVPTPTSERPVEQPRPAPDSVPTPNRIDTGAGPADPVNWLLIAVPALALLAMAGGGAYLLVARSERRR